MEKINENQLVDKLFRNSHFIQLLRTEISCFGSIKDQLSEPMEAMPKIIEQIYESIQSISKCTIKEALIDSQYEWVRRNQKIIKDIEQLKLALGEGNKTIGEISKFHSASHIKLDNLTEQSILAEMSPHHAEIPSMKQLIKGTITNNARQPSQTMRPNKRDLTLDVPQLHSRIFQNITIKSPVGRRINTDTQLNPSHQFYHHQKNCYPQDLQSTYHQNIILKRKIKQYEMKQHYDYESFLISNSEKFNTISSALNRIEKDLDEFKRSASSDINKSGYCPKVSVQKRKYSFASRLHWK